MARHDGIDIERKHRADCANVLIKRVRIEGSRQPPAPRLGQARAQRERAEKAAARVPAPPRPAGEDVKL